MDRVVGAVVSFAVLSVVLVHADRRGVPILLGLSVVYLIASLGFLVSVWVTKTSLGSLNFSVGVMLVFAGILSFGGNYAMFKAAVIAPNPGLAIAIANTFPALVLILALILFKDQVTFRQMLGVVIIILGITVITLGGNQNAEEEPLDTQAVEISVDGSG